MPSFYSGSHANVPPNAGDLWYHTDAGQLKVYNGQEWVPLHAPQGAVPLATGLVSTDGLTTGMGNVFLPALTGSPSYTPQIAGTTNMCAMAFDPVTNRLWVYNGSAWKGVTLA